MSRTESVVGKVARVVVQKGILHLEIVSVKGNFPDDISTWDGWWAVVHSDEDVAQLPGRQETPIEKEARENRERENRERDDDRRYEAMGVQLIADIPQDKTDPETCEYCCNTEGDPGGPLSCTHPDGKPEQPTGLETWKCGNFARRVVVIDPELEPHPDHDDHCPECGNSVVDENNTICCGLPVGTPCRCTKCFPQEAPPVEEGPPIVATVNQGATTCDACGEVIVFLRTAKGKQMPVNVESVAEGDVANDVLYDKTRHVSHFSTCPEASKFSKKA